MKVHSTRICILILNSTAFRTLAKMSCLVRPCLKSYLSLPPLRRTAAAGAEPEAEGGGENGGGAAQAKPQAEPQAEGHPEQQQQQRGRRRECQQRRRRGGRRRQRGGGVCLGQSLDDGKVGMFVLQGGSEAPLTHCSAFEAVKGAAADDAFLPSFCRLVSWAGTASACAVGDDD